MHLSIADLHKLIAGCTHYCNVYEDLGHSESLEQWLNLRQRLCDAHNEKVNWFDSCNEYRDELNYNLGDFTNG